MRSTRCAAPRATPPVWLLVGCLGGLFAAAGCVGLRAAQLYDRGTERVAAGAFEEAIRDLERARELRPEISGIHNHLGIAYHGAGREAEALAAFRHAVQLDCDNRAAWENLRRLENTRTSRDGAQRDP